MTMPIASLFGLAGLLGMPAARFLGTSAVKQPARRILCLPGTCWPARAVAFHYQLLV